MTLFVIFFSISSFLVPFSIESETLVFMTLDLVLITQIKDRSAFN